MNRPNYAEYFDVDEHYFPQINDSSIKEGESSDPDFWMRTFPHESFVDALKKLERILARVDKKSLWLQGAYGTGKSQCAYALRRILEVDESKVRDYWGKYDALKIKERDLLEKLLGHKSRGILTVYRYSASEIRDNRALFYAVQESVLASLKAKGCKYLGAASLKESIADWLSKRPNQLMFDALLEEKYTTFSYRDAGEVVDALQSGRNVDDLVEQILKIGEAEGVTAFTLTVERLCEWLADVVEKNGVQIVFVWDEFSEYFINNKHNLSAFQRLVELRDETSFYFVLVTHEGGSYFASSQDSNWRKLKDRFLEVEIKLPDKVAFELIGHALTVRDGMSERWSDMADDLNGRLRGSRRAVAELVKVDDKTMKKILPIHPTTAVALKYIASAFKSNQRSMFDFIKTVDDGETEAFQWFIQNRGPEDDRPLLTIDMLWNFFYEKGRQHLESSILNVLANYDAKKKNLREDEKVVLKAILIMQALNAKLRGAVSLFQATEENLRFVFEGTDYESARCCNIAQKMVVDGVLFKRKEGKANLFAAEMTAGNQRKIDDIKDKARNGLRTANLVEYGELKTALGLGPALRLRFEKEKGAGEIAAVTYDTLTKELNLLRDRGNESWRFAALVGFAKDAEEAEKLRRKLGECARDPKNRDVVFIDATSTILSAEQIEDYVEYEAVAQFYQGADVAASKNAAERAKGVLRDWKNAFADGRFVVYYGGKDWLCGSAKSLRDALQDIVVSKYPLTFDFESGLSENMLKATTCKQSAKCGLNRKTSGVVVNIEKRVFSSAEILTLPNYWEAFPTERIAKIKVKLDEMIADAFERDGRVSLFAVWDFLETKFGFARCNLYAFLTGFLLKEYGDNTKLRFADAVGAQGEMNRENLGEALGSIVDQKAKKDAFIVKQTAEERAFYDVMSQGWGAPKSCSTPAQAASEVAKCLLRRGLPLRFIEGVVDETIYKIARKFVDLAQRDGDVQLEIAREIGAIALKRPSLGNELKQALDSDNFTAGAERYLRNFDDGKLWEAAERIGARTRIIQDLKSRFERVKYQALWSPETQDEEARNLRSEYEFVDATNDVLKSTKKASSKADAFNALRDAARRIPFSSEQVVARYGEVENFVDVLKRICDDDAVSPDVLRATCAEIRARRVEIGELLNNAKDAFREVYAYYFEDLNEVEIERLRNEAPLALFERSTADCENWAQKAGDKIRQERKKNQLIALWNDKTASRSPVEWSERYKTPILCLVDENEYDDASRTFEILNKSYPNNNEINEALAYLERATFFDVMNDEARRNEALLRTFLPTNGARLLVSRDDLVNALSELDLPVFCWLKNPKAENRVRDLIHEKYREFGLERVLTQIDKMSESKLRPYLKRLVKGNATVGLEILGEDEL